jgi:hypothetical protein
MVGAARLRLRQDACQGSPTASLHRGIAPSCRRETRRASRPPPASASPRAANCCRTPRRRCRMPQPAPCPLPPMLLGRSGDVEQSLCAYSRSATPSIPTFRYAPCTDPRAPRTMTCLTVMDTAEGWEVAAAEAHCSWHRWAAVLGAASHGPGQYGPTDPKTYALEEASNTPMLASQCSPAQRSLTV